MKDEKPANTTVYQLYTKHCSLQSFLPCLLAKNNVFTLWFQHSTCLPTFTFKSWETQLEDKKIYTSANTVEHRGL